jgi:hypothetical protein
MEYKEFGKSEKRAIFEDLIFEHKTQAYFGASKASL